MYRLPTPSTATASGCGRAVFVAGIATTLPGSLVVSASARALDPLPDLSAGQPAWDPLTTMVPTLARATSRPPSKHPQVCAELTAQRTPNSICHQDGLAIGKDW